jgi:hypothetical protein
MLAKVIPVASYKAYNLETSLAPVVNK